MKRVAASLLMAGMVVAYSLTTFAGDNRFVFSQMTVTDKRTGLTWTRDADLGLRDWNGAFELVKILNKRKYAGFNDWRLPSREEAETLASYARGYGYNSASDTRRPYRLFNKMGFHNVQNGHYWSSSTNVTDIEYAWLLGMNNGTVENLSKQFPSYVWPVRGGK
jgi:Protein of unknown function (DUF1566)